jgi:hypothetical protein
VELFQKARTLFQKPKQLPQTPILVAELDDRVGGSRSKRSQIKAIIHRYEQGAVAQADAVEELLKVMR